MNEKSIIHLSILHMHFIVISCKSIDKLNACSATTTSMNQGRMPLISPQQFDLKKKKNKNNFLFFMRPSDKSSNVNR